MQAGNPTNMSIYVYIYIHILKKNIEIPISKKKCCMYKIIHKYTAKIILTISPKNLHSKIISINTNSPCTI
jgi:hypothetical protein